MEIIKCKECEFFVEDHFLPHCIGENGLFFPHPDDFCSCAMKKTEINTVKTLEEIKASEPEWRRNYIHTMYNFLKCVNAGLISPDDGFGYPHNGENFLKNVDIFTLIDEELEPSSREQFLTKYPYVAWYNK